MQRVAGKLQFQIDGEVHDAKGAYTYNLGRDKRELIIGVDAVHGIKEMPQAPYIEGTITDRGSLDVAALVSIEDATVTLSLNNGKVIVLREAWFTADGNVGTDEAEIEVRFDGKGAEEIS